MNRWTAAYKRLSYLSSHYGPSSQPHSPAQWALLCSVARALRGLTGGFQGLGLVRCWWRTWEEAWGCLGVWLSSGLVSISDSGFVLGWAPFTTTLHGLCFEEAARPQYLLMNREPTSSHSLAVTQEVTDFYCSALFLNYPRKWVPCIDVFPLKHLRRACFLD